MLLYKKNVANDFRYDPRNFSRSHLGFPFWNFMIFCNILRIFATSKLWSQSISAPGFVCTYTLSVFFLDTKQVHSYDTT